MGTFARQNHKQMTGSGAPEVIDFLPGYRMATEQQGDLWYVRQHLRDLIDTRTSCYATIALINLAAPACSAAHQQGKPKGDGSRRSDH